MRTESLRKQKIQMEQKLEEIEKAIATFSRKAVYVRDDEWSINLHKKDPLRVIMPQDQENLIGIYCGTIC